jgi:aryl-alcohol dehydrogenase-like predicted oxidoreductase
MSIGIADTYTSSAQTEDDAVALVDRALDSNSLDTANIYGDSEIKVGKALRGPAPGGGLGDEIRYRTRFVV